MCVCVCVCVCVCGVFRFQVTTEVKIRLAQEDSLAFLAAGISKTGCGTSGAAGIYASISSADDTIVVYEDLGMNLKNFVFHTVKNRVLQYPLLGC